ncbi:MAG: hypothetical protein ACREEC_12080 [Thermoplasmata archaeon]
MKSDAEFVHHIGEFVLPAASTRLPLGPQVSQVNAYPHVCYNNCVGQLKVHLAKLEVFRTDGLRDDISPELRVDALFLAAYQCVEAAAARINVHIGKHQNVRKELEANAEIFGEHSAIVWRAFQDLETRIRPKFIYGQSWSRSDLAEAVRRFKVVESRTKVVLAK